MDNHKIRMRKEWNILARKNPYYLTIAKEEFLDLENIEIDNYFTSGRENVDRLLKKVKLRNPKSMNMAEIGCGFGRMTHRFSEIFNHVYAIDVSDEFIKKATYHFHHLENVDFILGDGATLQEIPTGTIDFVFSWEVFQHIPSQDIQLNYIRESARVLKKGGIAFLCMRTNRPKIEPSLLDYGFMGATQYFSKRLAEKLRINKIFRRKVKKKLKPELDSKFAMQFASWQGVKVHPRVVLNTAKEAGMKIRRTSGFGSHYCYFTFMKI